MSMIKINILDSVNILNLSQLKNLEELYIIGGYEKPSDIQDYSYLSQLSLLPNLKVIHLSYCCEFDLNNVLLNKYITNKNEYYRLIKKYNPNIEVIVN